MRTNVEISSQRKRHQRSVTKTQISDLRPRNFRPSVMFLWSRNVQKKQDILISPPVYPDRSDSEKLTRFKITADILIRFAGEYFTEEIKDMESL